MRAQRTDEAAVVADLLAQSLHDDTLRPQLAAYYRFAAAQAHEHLLSSLLAMGFKPKVSPELLPRIMLGLLDGLVMQQFVEPGVLDTKQVVQAIETIAASLFEIGPPPKP